MGKAMTSDPSAAALKRIMATLEKLSAEERARVLAALRAFYPEAKP